MTQTTATRAGSDLPGVRKRHSESSVVGLALHSTIQCKRMLMVWTHDPATLIQALAYPALTLVMLRLVLGDSISAATGQPSIYGTVPMITLIAAMTGGIVSALGLRIDAKEGLLSRFAAMPVHRAAGLVGRLAAEAVRIVLTTILIVGVGYGLGFRLHQGFLATLAFLGLPIVFGMGFAVFITALATIKTDIPLVDIVAISTTLLMFFNTGFVPVGAYPIWLQDVVANQPMSCAVEAMKGLSLGGPVADSLWKTLAWSVGMVGIFMVPAVVGYRRAAEMGG